MNQYDLTPNLKINLGYCDLHFMSNDFIFILTTICFMNIIIRNYESVWPDVYLKNVGHCDL